MKILIVEDEPGLQLGLTDLFEDAGYTTRVCGEGQVAMEWIPAFQPDLIVLDLGLPDLDGTRILEALKTRTLPIPVLVLTSRANEADILLGFKLGALDYVTKPFSPRVLLARVEALFRGKTAPSKPKGALLLGSLSVDFERYQAFREGQAIHLTTREIDLLEFLHANQGKPVSRNDILDEIWGMDSEAGPRTVDTHIALLRKKIEPNPEKPTYLLSQRGIGYKLVLS